MFSFDLSGFGLALDLNPEHVLVHVVPLVDLVDRNVHVFAAR